MPGLITNWPRLIASRSAYLQEVMLDELAQAAPVWKELYNVGTMTEYQEVYESLNGFGLDERIDSEIPDQWPTSEMTQGYNKTFTQVWYGNGHYFSKKFNMYDKDGLKAYGIGRGLVKAGLNTQEFYASLIFNNLTSTGTDYVLPDGVALASDSHPLQDNLLGGLSTYDNYVAAALDHDNLATAINLMMQTPDQRGLPVVSQPSKLWLHPSLIHDAKEILGSELRSDTMENTTNVLRDYNLRIVAWRWLSSATNWGLQATKHFVEWKTGQGIETRTQEDFDNYSMKAKTDQFFTKGVIDWRGMVVGNI